LLAGVPAAAAGVVIAIALPTADLRAQAGWDAFAGGEFSRAAERYQAAARINPFERNYARRETVALVAAASVDPGRLPDAERALRRFDRRFGFEAGDAFNLAAVLVATGRPPEEVLPVVQRLVALNPHGVATAWYAGQLIQAVHDGGVLVFDDTDRWTYIVPLPSIAPEGP
jgi:hypothetical protein